MTSQSPSTTIWTDLDPSRNSEPHTHQVWRNRAKSGRIWTNLNTYSANPQPPPANPDQPARISPRPAKTSLRRRDTMALNVHDAGGSLMAAPYRLSYVMYAPCEDTEDMYMAEIPALPGCRAWGETPELVLEYLESVAEAFIASYQQRDKPLPPEILQTGQLVVSG